MFLTSMSLSHFATWHLNSEYKHIGCFSETEREVDSMFCCYLIFHIKALVIKMNIFVFLSYCLLQEKAVMLCLFPLDQRVLKRSEK